MAANSGLSPAVQIRLATAADIPAIVPVINAAFAVETFVDGTRTDEAHLAETMQQGEILAAEEATGRIVASVFTKVNGNRGYFGMLAVDPSKQGSGLGRLMIDAAEKHCRDRGCHFIDIVVLSLRPELPPIYRKFGYIETGTEEFHPSRPIKPGVKCHVINMSKRLTLE